MTSISDFTENCKTDVSALIPPVQIFAISRMVACISHDLRQPLTAILANAEFLARPNLSQLFLKVLRKDVEGAERLMA